MSAHLRPADLVPVGGGGWSGLLFDNPRSGLAPRLTWTFDFRYRDVVRDYGETPVTLTLDWIPLSARSWRGMAGQTWRGTEFGEDGEASVYRTRRWIGCGADRAIWPGSRSGRSTGLWSLVRARTG